MEYRLISAHWRNQGAVLQPGNVLVQFDEDGISEPVEKAVADACHGSIGLMIFSTPNTIPGQTSGIEEDDESGGEEDSEINLTGLDVNIQSVGTKPVRKGRTPKLRIA